MSALGGALLLTVSLLVPSLTFAQSIKLDGSLGPRTTLAGPGYTIPHDLGQTRGANLFHSFEQFNVLTGESATFTGPNTIQRVISRVTGGVQSFIDGLLGTNFAGAKPELYLVNPSGIVFGSNARLNVAGSAHFTTADYLKMINETRFYSSLGVNESVISAEPVAAFGFLTSSPRPIIVQESVLQVPGGQTLSFIGGDLVIRGGPFGFQGASGGQINLASVASQGEVPRNVETLDRFSVPFLGLIVLSEHAALDVSSTSGAGGSVVIRGGQIVMQDSLVRADTRNLPSRMPISIDIQAQERLDLRGETAILSRTTGIGRAGDIYVQAREVLVQDGAQMESSSFGSGDGGSMRIHADEVALLRGTDPFDQIPSGLRTFTGLTGSLGNAGDIVLQAREVLVLDGAQIESGTFGLGSGGHIAVLAEGIELRGTDRFGRFPSGMETFARGRGTFSGNAGDIAVSAFASIVVADGARIDSVSFGPGPSGALRVQTNDLLVVGKSSDGAIPSGLGTGTSGPTATGSGGLISVFAGTLILTDGAEIRTSSGPGFAEGLVLDVGVGQIANGGTLSTDSVSGRGGPLSINSSGSLTINGGILATGTITGVGGALSVHAHDQLLLANGGRIETTSAGSGQAGALSISAGSVMVQGRDGLGPSRVTSFAADGLAGQVSVISSLMVMEGGLIGATPGKVTPLDVIDLTRQSMDSFVPHSDTASLLRGKILGLLPDLMDPSLPRPPLDLITLDRVDAALNDVSGFLPNRETASRAVKHMLNGLVNEFDPAIWDHVIERLTDVTRETLRRTTSLDTMTLVRSEASLPGNPAGGSLVDKVATQLTDLPADKVRARNVVNIILIDAGGTPENVAGGDLAVEVGQVRLTHGAELTTRTQGSGRAGDLRLTASESVWVDGASRVTSESTASGDAGRVVVVAPKVTVDSSEFTTASSGSGLAGDIVLRGDMVSLTNTRVDSSTTGPIGGGTLTIHSSGLFALSGRQGSMVTSSTGDGSGGNIDVQAGRLELTEGATLAATSSKAGDAGSIRLRADDAILLRDSTVTTRAEAASGGDITLIAPILIQLGNSRIESSVAGGTATKGGNILLDPQSVIIRNSQILANAVQGAGGNITIAGNVVLVDPASVIDASSALGVSGQVAIQAPVNNVATALSRLSQTPLNATELLTARCSARLREGRTSSLTVAGRDGVPAEPGSWRPTAFPFAGLRPPTAPTVAARPASTTRPPLILQSPHPEFYALRDAAPLPLGCGS